MSSGLGGREAERQRLKAKTALTHNHVERVQFGDRVFLWHADVDEIAVRAEEEQEVVEREVGGVCRLGCALALAPHHFRLRPHILSTHPRRNCTHSTRK